MDSQDQRRSKAEERKAKSMRILCEEMDRSLRAVQNKNVYMFLIFVSLFCSIQSANIITPLSSKTGLFFQDLGNVYNEIDDWILFDTFNLSSIRKQIDLLKDSARNLSQLKDKNHNIIVPDEMILKFSNLTKVLDDYYNTIVPPSLHRRQKRGLFNTIGRINKLLFGTMDDEDEQKFTENIKSLQQESSAWKSLALNNVGLMKDTLTNIKENVQKFKDLESNFNNLTAEVHNLGNEIFLAKATSFFLAQYNLIYEPLNIIHETIMFSSVRIDPELISPSEIFDTLSSITLPKNRKFPLDLKDENFREFLALCKLDVAVKFNTVIFIITIPILETNDYSIYKTHLLPIVHSSYSTFIKNPSTYFVWDPTEKKYANLPDLSYCKQLWEGQFLCSLHMFSKSNDNCEYQIFNKKNSTACQLVSLPLNFEVWTPLSKNQWLFSLSTPCDAEIKRDNEEYTLQLRGSGILTVPSDTFISTPTVMFYGHSKYNSSLNHVIGDFSYFNPGKLDDSNITYRTVNFETKTIDDLERRWDQEKEKIKNIKLSKMIDYTNYYPYICILIVILLYLAYKICRCVQNSNGSNKFNINLGVPTNVPTNT